MKVVLLAGGFGTRLSEYTELIPKPLVRIGNIPIICHIMQYYSSFGYEDFLLALGYKSDLFKEYFLNFYNLSSDFTVNLSTGNVSIHNQPAVNWNVSLIDTGLNTLTGGRLLRLREYIGKETFLLTYGDGLSNIDIDKVLEFHRSHGKMVTMSAVRPSARFGELIIEEDKVSLFQEKPQLQDGWINGGYFVMEPTFLDLISGDNVMLEREPLEVAASRGELMAYKHDGFWQCMDTKRDHALLESLWETNSAPWKC